MMQWLQQQMKNGLGWRVMNVLLPTVAAIFYALHFLHLTADFPNHSPWMDWAKFTDEGWYGNAAIEYYLRGHWHVAGDFNPAAALPVWPLLLAVVFKFTGVSLAAARALAVTVFGATLLAVWALVQRYYGALTASLAILLLAVSPFCYAFVRLAILEPLLVLLMTLSLLAASHAAPGKRWPWVAVGLLLPLMVLTKTTAIFLMPAIFLMLLFQLHARWKTFFLQTIGAGAIAATVMGSYLYFLWRWNYLADFKYLFAANSSNNVKLIHLGRIFATAMTSGMWMDVVLFPAFLVLAAWAIGMTVWSRLQWLRTQPLLVTLLVWAAGYFAFLAYHNNIQPRYYLVISVPMTIAVAITAEDLWLWLRDLSGRYWRWGLASAIAATLLLAVATDARLLLTFVRTPEYSFVNAAQEFRNVVEADPAHNNLVMSISGNEMSLMNQLPAICDDFGTMELDERIAAYRPGWYIAWNAVEDDKQESLDKFYRLQRAAVVPAMDDPDRNVLILYKLVPRTAQDDQPVKKPRGHARLLQTGLDGLEKTSPVHVQPDL